MPFTKVGLFVARTSATVARPLAPQPSPATASPPGRAPRRRRAPFTRASNRGPLRRPGPHPSEPQAEGIELTPALLRELYVVRRLSSPQIGAITWQGEPPSAGRLSHSAQDPGGQAVQMPATATLANKWGAMVALSG